MAWGKQKTESPISPTWDEDLERIRKLAPPPPEETIYGYLKAVYRRGRKLGTIDEKKQKKLNKIAGRYRQQIKFNRFRLIIEMTAPSHMTSKMKWKYTKTLQYARHQDTQSKDLIKFIKSEGGINACVKKYKPSMG